MVEKRSVLSQVVLYSFLVVLALISVVPFYMMIINSTHSNQDIARQLWLIPGNQLLVNYQSIIERVNIWRGFMASVIISAPSVFLAGFFGAMTAYGFAKFTFKGKEILFWFILATMMIPQQLGLIGYFTFIQKLGMIDSYLPLIIPSIASAGMVFFVRQYIQSSIPDSLIEAAIIDGAREGFIFTKIIIPLAMPSIATMSIFVFIGKWNDLLTPLVLLFDKAKFPMPVVVANINGLYERNYGAIYLGVSISVIPIILVVIAFSKKLINGLTIGAVKG